MPTQRLGIIMHGVTGRMGMNQHLIRSIVAIRNQGGVTLSNGDKVMPDPILIGRNAEKMEALAKQWKIERWGTDLDKALANKDDSVFFDAGTTQMRPTLLAKAIRAGKHVYCEKPIATNLNEAVEIARLAEKSGLKHGAVQDKLFLPGLRKLDMLRRAGFFGRMLSVRLEFGYWVFEGDLQPIQRPSWNYRTEDGGGMILDMMCHWRYVLDNLFGEVKSVSCIGATHIPERWDEAGKPYKATADDAAYATAELTGHNGEPVIAQLNMSWATRVNREDLVTAIDRFQMQRATATGNAIVISLATLFPDAGIDLQQLQGGRDRQRGFAIDGEKKELKEFKPVPPGSYTSAAIIMLTDGQRTTGVDPLEAAKLAAERGVRVYTVGIGTVDGETIGFEGWSMRVRLDEETLKAVASKTAAEYFYAGTAADLKKVYETLSSRLTVEKKETEVSALLAMAAAALALLSAGLSLLWFNRIL